MTVSNSAVLPTQETFRVEAVDSAPPSQTGHTTYETTRKLAWHYTHSRSFDGILKDGMIRPATAHVPAGESPITWFSTEQFWEPSVFKGRYLPDGMIEQLDMLACGRRTCAFIVLEVTKNFFDASTVHFATGVLLGVIIKVPGLCVAKTITEGSIHWEYWEWRTPFSQLDLDLLTRTSETGRFPRERNWIAHGKSASVEKSLMKFGLEVGRGSVVGHPETSAPFSGIGRPIECKISPEKEAFVTIGGAEQSRGRF